MTQRAAVRGRRLLASLALSAVAVGALSACQGQPGTAATVGGTRITVDEIERSISGVVAACESAKATATPEPGATAAPVPPPCVPPVEELRAFAVQDKVAIEVAKRYAAEHGIKAPTVSDQDVAQTAEQLGVPADNAFVRDFVTATAWANSLDDATNPVTPTDADLRGIYDRALRAGITDQPFPKVRVAISQIQGLGQAVGVQRELQAAADKYGVTINPRYQPAAEIGNPINSLEMPLLRIQGPGGAVTVLAVEFGHSASPAVASVPSPGSTGTDTGTGESAP
ncbi:MAG TPA: hypothetical protein VKB69_07710 [Micromonosporaceae bacterium]|nr:hypothetical protein [Micromonosporaceae bacterium]